MRPSSEEADAIRKEREARLEEIAWRHIEACQERFIADTETARDIDAYQESSLMLSWIDRYKGMTG